MNSVHIEMNEEEEQVLSPPKDFGERVCAGYSALVYLAIVVIGWISFRICLFFICYCINP
jgi:hypothetical protein